jgi:LPS sulfotransferase NodH
VSDAESVSDTLCRVTGPRRSVFICGIQRSGTWLLAHLLQSTGVVGRPGEFFSPDDARRFREDWRASRFEDYLARVFEVGTSPNGVFAAKLMWNYFEEFMFEIRRLVKGYERPDLEVISSVFPAPRFVFICREDVLAQAVSWSKAAQTGQYAAHQGKTGEAVFDFDHIEGLRELVLVQNGAWRRWFDAHEIEPFEVTYEELCADQVGVTMRTLSFLDLEPLRDATIASPLELRKQADAVNAEWISRYQEMAAQ